LLHRPNSQLDERKHLKMAIDAVRFIAFQWCITDSERNC